MRYVATLAALLLAATACSSDERGSDTATDPRDPTAPPADRREVPSPVVVMDVGRPELCLGPVAESYPPQCGGPAIRGWRWHDHAGHYEQVDRVRWGEFRVEGYFDGDEFVVTAAAPA